MYKNIYEKIIKDSPIPYFLVKGIKDLYDEYINLEILDVNLAFSNMLGIDSESLINTLLRDVCEGSCLLSEINKSFKVDYNKEKTTYEVHDDILDKYFKVDVYIADSDIFGIRLTEINKDKLILSNIIRNSPFSAWVKGRDGRYMDVNYKFASKSGKSYSEIIGKTDEELWPIKEAEKYRQEDINIMKSRKVDTYNEFIKYETEEYRLYETTKWPYVDKNNNILGTIGISLEVVDNIELRKNLEENEENFKEIINY
ncbi:MAG: PAS domain-containing protein, partial [Paraclostridium sp.]